MLKRAKSWKTGYTILEVIIVIAMITILMSALYLPHYAEKEKIGEIQATVNYVVLLIKACHDWRERTGSLSFSGFSMTSLTSTGLWSSTSFPLGSTVTVGPSSSDTTKVTVTLSGWLSKVKNSDKQSIITALQKRGYSASQTWSGDVTVTY